MGGVGIEVGRGREGGRQSERAMVVVSSGALAFMSGHASASRWAQGALGTRKAGTPHTPHSCGCAIAKLAFSAFALNAKRPHREQQDRTLEMRHMQAES
jgi:hypothetical protein